MRPLEGRVAVITGAAGGIGLALAHRCAQAGMKVALADVDEPELASAVDVLTAAGAEALGVRADVSELADVEALRDQALDRSARCTSSATTQASRQAASSSTSRGPRGSG